MLVPLFAFAELVRLLGRDLDDIADLTRSHDVAQRHVGRFVAHGQQHSELDPIRLDGRADTGKVGAVQRERFFCDDIQLAVAASMTAAARSPSLLQTATTSGFSVSSIRR